MSVESSARPFWLVGASFKGVNDQLDRFLEEGVWETDTSNESRHADVRKVQPGDRLVVKSSYVRKNGLPFENRDHFVSVMGIKAIGTVLENPGDGLHLRVRWDKSYDEPREWYFYTLRKLITRVEPNEPNSQALYRFIFDEEEQDYGVFRNQPSWEERFGDNVEERDELYDDDDWADGVDVQSRYALWDLFLEEWPVERVRAMTLPEYTNLNRSDAFVYWLESVAQNLGSIWGGSAFKFGVYARSNSAVGRENPTIESDGTYAWSAGLGATAEEAFQTVRLGILQVIEAAQRGDLESVAKVKVVWPGVKWKIAFIYQDRDSPVVFPVYKRDALYESYRLLEPSARRTKARPAEMYPALLRYYATVGDVFAIGNKVWAEYKATVADKLNSAPDEIEEEYEPADEDIVPYTLESILSDGAFVETDQLELIHSRLRQKKNLILQGPPGTGKTWLAKRMAYALIGEKLEENVRAIQFHPNMSYEDFVRGYRPSGEGKLTLTDGPLLRLAETARKNPDENYVVVIEEINRGNPAQIFGEMLTLLEADKRSPDDALTLSYMRDGEEPFFLPPNVYVIGTMNIADRSLAMVDLALRRRFAFVTLKPNLNDRWRQWLNEKFTIPTHLIDTIQTTVHALNRHIKHDPMLGEQYNIGHSYVTPTQTVDANTPEEWHAWFKGVVETEIFPLLEEYWSDNLERLEEVRQDLYKNLKS